VVVPAPYATPSDAVTSLAHAAAASAPPAGVLDALALVAGKLAVKLTALRWVGAVVVAARGLRVRVAVSSLAILRNPGVEAEDEDDVLAQNDSAVAGSFAAFETLLAHTRHLAGYTAVRRGVFFFPLFCVCLFILTDSFQAHKVASPTVGGTATFKAGGVEYTIELDVEADSIQVDSKASWRLGADGGCWGFFGFGFGFIVSASGAGGDGCGCSHARFFFSLSR
jgi:hypothetical protein